MLTSTRLLLLATVTATLTGAAVAAAAGPAAAAPSKPAVVRDGNIWLLRNTLSGGAATTTFGYGASSDIIHVTGDWDGNGTKTPGIIRIVGDFENSHYVWYLRNSNSAGAADIVFTYGKPSFGFEEPGDTPVVGDWDGNGTDTAGVVRRRNGAAQAQWLLRNSAGGGAAQLQFGYGLTSDGPVTGDWDGNGTDTPGAVRGIGGGSLTWLLRNTNSAGTAGIQFNYGNGLDVPVAGDWDGNGTDGPGVLRPGSGRWTWLLRNPLTSGAAGIQFSYGLVSTDDPVIWQ
jgi:hypothetical protein